MNTITVRSMGDRKQDGAVQLSFTLPVPRQAAHAAAVAYCRHMNLHQVEVVSLQPLDEQHTYVQVFAKANFSITVAQQPVQETRYTREEIIARTQRWPAPLVIAGACTGTDAHTVGLDAILNKKGYKGDKGLESYPCFKVINLGSQVKNSELLKHIQQQHVQVLLVSQIITHQNVHLHNLTELIDMLEAANLRSQLLCIVGGPRITHALALELGFDAGFGIGSTATEVANLIYQYIEKKNLMTWRSSAK